MTSIRSTFVATLLWLCLVSLNQCRGEDTAEETKILKETVRRYFASIGGYHEGDLITRSQVEDLQLYLRRTRGHSAATHARILRRILPDDSRLVRLFYQKNGAELLRQAAVKNGGYEVFDRLSRSTAKYSQLVEATDRGSIEKLNRLTDEESQQQLAAREEKSGKNKGYVRLSRIYTIEEYLAAIISPTKTETPIAPEEAPQQ
ncbi:MAG: hypothetical protein GXP26_17395 [Planctomycetes bacterium]|nr:hypothetical protein [Planctomycetota bacterium]